MDTTNNKAKEQLEKLASKGVLDTSKGVLDMVGPLVALPKDTLMTYLTAVAALGMAGGAGLGAISSYVKTKNPKLTALARKKDFYDKKVREIDNENWLNDVMTAKKKLETARLTEEERAALEDHYINLINK